MSPLQAIDLAHDLKECAADAGSDVCERIDALLAGEATELTPPSAFNGAAARARLRVLAETLEALDRGEKQASDVVWLARQLTAEVRR